MPGAFYIEGKKEKLDISEIVNIVNEMKSIVSEVKTDITQVQNDITQVQNDIVQVQNDVSQVVVSSGKQLLSMDFWSAPQEAAQIDGAGVTVSLPAVMIEGLPDGATILRAVAMLKFRMVENTNAAANGLDGETVAGTSQVIQVRDDTPGAWGNAIAFVDGQFSLKGEVRESGDVCIGSINIDSIVVVNDIYEFQWLLGKADQDFINFNDIQTGIRVWYSVPPS
jgi:flagellin-like hook-associated protein FlgL